MKKAIILIVMMCTFYTSTLLAQTDGAENNPAMEVNVHFVKAKNFLELSLGDFLAETKALNLDETQLEETVRIFKKYSPQLEEAKRSQEELDYLQNRFYADFASILDEDQSEIFFEISKSRK